MHSSLIIGGRAFWVLTFFALSSNQARAGDWPQWRGPTRDGVAADFRLPDPLPDQLRPLWRVQVGEGHSGPIIADGRLFALSREDDDEVVRALDAASGREIWLKRYRAPYAFVRGAQRHGKGPKATPAYDCGRAYTFGISQALSCFAAETGELIWRREFRDEFPMTWPEFGTASSILIERDLVIAQIGARDTGAVAAFDKATGERRWRTEDEGPAYASPRAFDLAGERQIVTLTRLNLVGLRATDGERLWSLPFTTHYEENIACPLIFGDTLVYGGVQAGIHAVRIEPVAGRALEPRSLWSSDDHDLYMSSPIALGEDVVFLSSKKKGALVRAEAATGRIIWESRGRFGENASLILTGDDKLLALTSEAELSVIDATAEEFSELAKWEVAPSPTWAHPAIAGGVLYVKDAEHIAAMKF